MQKKSGKRYCAPTRIRPTDPWLTRWTRLPLYQTVKFRKLAKKYSIYIDWNCCFSAGCRRNQKLRLPSKAKQEQRCLFQDRENSKYLASLASIWHVFCKHLIWHVWQVFGKYVASIWLSIPRAVVYNEYFRWAYFRWSRENISA